MDLGLGRLELLERHGVGFAERALELVQLRARGRRQRVVVAGGRGRRGPRALRGGLAAGGKARERRERDLVPGRRPMRVRHEARGRARGGRRAGQRGVAAGEAPRRQLCAGARGGARARRRRARGRRSRRWRRRRDARGAAPRLLAVRDPLCGELRLRRRAPRRGRARRRVGRRRARHESRVPRRDERVEVVEVLGEDACAPGAIRPPPAVGSEREKEEGGVRAAAALFSFQVRSTWCRRVLSFSAHAANARPNAARTRTLRRGWNTSPTFFTTESSA